MSKVSTTKRSMIIAQRAKRRTKVRELKELYQSATTDSRKTEIYNKLKRIAPDLASKGYLGSK